MSSLLLWMLCLGRRQHESNMVAMTASSKVSASVKTNKQTKAGCVLRDLKQLQSGGPSMSSRG